MLEKHEDKEAIEKQKALEELELVKQVRLESLDVIENLELERPSSRYINDCLHLRILSH